MKVLLIKPYLVTDEVLPPLGLGYLATTIRDKHSVRLIDGIKEKFTLDRFKSEVGKYDVVCIQCYTLDKPIVRKMISIAKKINPSVVTVVGGPEPSSNVESVFDYLGADYGFKGEAEIGFPILVDYISEKKIKLDKIPSLIWKKGKETVVNKQEFINNLDDLKHPSWDLIKPNTYPLAPHGAFFKRKPIASVFATRGCPFQCTFCAGWLISGRKIRYRSIKNFVNEIELLHRKYGVNEIHIEDDNFSMKRDFVVGFCNELLKRKIDITWACPNGIRLDTLDEGLLRLMKRSGLYVVSVGIESGSDRILKDMKKNLTKKQIRDKVNLIHKVGLDLVGFFILGYPGETVKDINDSINFACELPLKRVSFMTFKPFPGTEASKKIKKELKCDVKWENFALNKIAYSPVGISHKQLKKLRQKALIKFYFRPKIMFSFFTGIKSLEHAKYVFERVFRWLFK